MQTSNHSILFSGLAISDGKTLAALFRWELMTRSEKSSHA
jgi:hypothetical protein